MGAAKGSRVGKAKRLWSCRSIPIASFSSSLDYWSVKDHVRLKDIFLTRGDCHFDLSQSLYRCRPRSMTEESLQRKKDKHANMAAQRPGGAWSVCDFFRIRLALNTRCLSQTSLRHSRPTGHGCLCCAVGRVLCAHLNDGDWLLVLPEERCVVLSKANEKAESYFIPLDMMAYHRLLDSTAAIIKACRLRVTTFTNLHR